MVNSVIPPGVAVIRPPAAADADAIARVHVQSWRETYADLLPAKFYDDRTLVNRTRMWRQLLGREQLPARLRVAQYDGQIVGVALADAPPEGEFARELHLHLIYLLARVQGLGIGRALLEAVIGDEPAELWVAAENARAIAFYRRNGLAPDGAQKVDQELEGLLEIRLVR